MSVQLPPASDGAQPPAESEGWNARLAETYDRVAERYAAAFFDELDRKPFDRDLLDSFAERLSGRGPVADIGCGPGHIARYLHERGLDARGLDLSGEMVALACRLSPALPFEQGDMRDLPLDDGTLAGIVAFYSLIHIARDAVPGVLAEMRRVLVPGGALLIAVHGGTGEHHASEFLGEPASIDATFFAGAELRDLIATAGFIVEQVLEREPYDGEFPSRRVYVLASLPPRAQR